MKTIKIINIMLIIITVVLIINLIQPINTIMGNLIYSIDKSDPKCFFSNSDKINEIPMDICCYEIQKQLTCKIIDEKQSELKCYVSETSPRYYLINYKTFNYCKKEGFDVKIE